MPAASPPNTEPTTVFFLANVEWHFTWQSCQTIAQGLAERGFVVHYLNPLPKRLPGIAELGRLTARLTGRPRLAGHQGNPLPPGVTLWNPLCLPATGPTTRMLAHLMLLPLIHRLQRIREQAPRCVVVTALPFRLPHRVAQALRPDLLLYLCRTHWAADPRAPQNELCEDAVLQDADLVLPDSDLLHERCRFHPGVRSLPAMVALDRFREVPPSSERAHGPHGKLRCTYYGGISWRLDLPLLAEVSRRFQLRLIGPVRADLGGLAPETEIIGTVGHDALQRYLDDTDVLLLPYARHEFTKGIMPAKLFEYLATGLPIVATDALPTLRPYAHVIRIEGTAEGFMRAIEHAPHEDQSFRGARLALAQEHSVVAWMDRLASWIEAGLNKKRQTKGASD